jgi:DNA mismatch repair protein PMS2
MIRPLDAGTVRNLCAGQVLSSVAGVVKELLENSLDAKATQVTIALYGHGLDRISVSDDGEGFSLGGGQGDDATVGVAPEDIMARRVSSKRRRSTPSPTADIVTAEDSSGVEASSVDSLGFRGEALHSLAQLSDLVIDTMMTSATSAVTLTHSAEHNTTTVSPSTTRTSHGTTVASSNLFARFPVRRGELQRSKKKQLQDAVHLVKQYALSRPDVKLHLQHRIDADGACVTLVATSGSGDLQRSLGEAYGGRIVGSMLHVNWGSLPHCEVSGYISPVGSGRATSDMQVFALDGRVVDLPKLAKTLHDTFLEAHPNAAQRTCPAYFLALKTDGTAAYDVNLAPNKRRVLLQLEREWVESLRHEALRMFKTSTDAMEITAATKNAVARDLARADERRMSLTLTPVSATSHTQVIHSSERRSPSGNQPLNESSRKRERDDATRSVGFETSLRSDRSLLLDDADSVESAAAQASTVDVGEDEDVAVVTDEGLLDYHLHRRAARFESRFPDLASLPLSRVAEQTIDSTDHSTTAKRGTTSKGMRTKKISKSINAQTEEELNQMLHKTDFAKMEIHGQFNHGFIVASMGDDLYIIDQHASDEKYNYEQLCQKYVARPQPLVKPIRVAMEADEALMALERASELRLHGFIVQRSSDQQQQQDDASSANGNLAVTVASVPILPYDTVVPQDVCELTAQLLQYQSIVRPLKAVWHSMATKACRSSIMIGAVLNDKMMRTIVDHLGTLDQPWNCPHGRPTLRYLGSLATFRDDHQRID